MKLGARLVLPLILVASVRLADPRASAPAPPASGSGWLGVESIDLPPALREHFGAPANAGVMISAVVAGGPAEAAGVRVGDVVFEVEGEPVRAVGNLRALISAGGIDNRLEIHVMRDG